MTASTMPSHSGTTDKPDGKALQRENERLRRENEDLRERLEREESELGMMNARFARYETVLRGSKITVSTQDPGLRYASISDDFCGRKPEDMLGRTDEELFPGEAGKSMTALKRAALDSGEQRRAEMAVEDFPGERWFDLHVEPLTDARGAVIGVACVAVDITKRKEDEAHLRLLLRELTHRSKNLLAVIQAMARQTARHSGSIGAFLTQFGGRLQSLAAAHDVLVRESWHGASMQELVRVQLGAYLDGAGQRVVMQGPPIVLKPEAAQSLGLALHELAANAARFGALSVAQGKVAISWSKADTARGEALVLDWREQAGPPVKGPRRKGFGSTAIERHLAAALDANVSLDFDPQGLHCHIVIPAVHLVSRSENASAAR